MSQQQHQTLVIDNGTSVLKCGFAGGERPYRTFPSCVGRPKRHYDRVMVQGKLDQDLFVGQAVQDHRGIMKINYPMHHGIVMNWNDMEHVWDHVYDTLNIASPVEHPVLLTEAPLNPRRNREKAAEYFFEKSNAPALYVSPQATLSLYASGKTTGVVLDSGAGVTHAVPVYEGFNLNHAVTRVDIAGRDVDDYLQRLLRRAGYIFHTSAEQEVVRMIKETSCYVSYDRATINRGFSSQQRHNGNASTGSTSSNTPEEAKGGKNTDNAQPNDDSLTEYRLPDGRLLRLGSKERTLAPEILFDPALIGSEYTGVHECLMDSILKSDLDLRRTLFSDIVLAGGSTLFRGYGDRLLNELRRLSERANFGEIKIRINAPPNRKELCWIGGSILASLATFKKMWITKDEYNEHGANILHRRLL
eukprot:g4148.t1